MSRESGMGNREWIDASRSAPTREGRPAALALPIPDSRFPIPGFENKNPGTEGERFRGRGARSWPGGAVERADSLGGGGSESQGRHCTAGMRDCAGGREFKRSPESVQRGFRRRAVPAAAANGGVASRACAEARRGRGGLRWMRVDACAHALQIPARSWGRRNVHAATPQRPLPRRLALDRSSQRFSGDPKEKAPRAGGSSRGLGAGRRSGETSPSVYSLKGEGVNRTGIAPVVLRILRGQSESPVTAGVTIEHN